MDREKVIKGLTVCSEHGLLNGEDCHGHYEYTDNLADIIKANDYSKQCPYNGCETGCVKTLAKDVFAMLKEQEPKVLTVDQLEDALDTVVWLETPVSENLADGYSLIMAYSHKYGYMIFDSPFGDNPSQDKLEYSEYGKSWRCWDKRPTDEQRHAVKWE